MTPIPQVLGSAVLRFVKHAEWANGRYYHRNDDRGYVVAWRHLPPAPGETDEA